MTLRDFPYDDGRSFPIVSTRFPQGGGFLNHKKDPYASLIELNVQFEGNSGDQVATDLSKNAHALTFGNSAFIDTSQFKGGVSALHVYDGATVNPSQGYVSAPDNAGFALGGNDFTIETYCRFDTLAPAFQFLMSKYNSTGNNREWYLALTDTSSNLVCFFSDDGTGSAPAFNFRAAWPNIAIDTWFHVAVTREVNTVALWVDGANIISNSISINVKDGTSEVWMGKFKSTGFDDHPINGFLDGCRITNGATRYPLANGNFTPPSLPYLS